MIVSSSVSKFAQMGIARLAALFAELLINPTPKQRQQVLNLNLNLEGESLSS